MMIKVAAIFLSLACIAGANAKPLNELKLGSFKIDTDHVECKSNLDIIDECGLQQGFSYKFSDFAYPMNHTFLLSSCKRQADALKCLRAYSKCLQPLTKQVLLAMINSRQKYQKKVCSEKLTESATRLIELNQCMSNDKASFEKGVQAELNAITIPEAIVSSKIDNAHERLKLSCCSVAKVRKEYVDAAFPHCKQHLTAATELIDSYLAETVGIICPDFDSRPKPECEKLPKLSIAKSSNSRYFLRPILNVVQTLT